MGYGYRSIVDGRLSLNILLETRTRNAKLSNLSFDARQSYLHNCIYLLLQYMLLNVSRLTT